MMFLYGNQTTVKNNNNVKRTHDVFITESNNSENYIIITKKTRCFYKGIKQQWKLNNNMKKKRHNVFIRESNNSEN